MLFVACVFYLCRLCSVLYHALWCVFVSFVWCFIQCLSEMVVFVVYFTVVNLPVSLFNLTLLDHARGTIDAAVATL